MFQIIRNYAYIFVFPFLAGTAVRVFFRSIKRAYLISAVFALLAAAAWIAAVVIPSRGSELNYLRTFHAASAAAGSLLTGLILTLRNKGRTD